MCAISADVSYRISPHLTSAIAADGKTGAVRSSTPELGYHRTAHHGEPRRVAQAYRIAPEATRFVAYTRHSRHRQGQADGTTVERLRRAGRIRGVNTPFVARSPGSRDTVDGKLAARPSAESSPGEHIARRTRDNRLTWAVAGNGDCL